MIPPKAAPTENMDRESQPSRPAALDELEEPPPELEPDPEPELEGADEVGFDPDVAEGVKTPPDGSWARHEDAADAASSAVLGPAHDQHARIYRCKKKCPVLTSRA